MTVLPFVPPKEDVFQLSDPTEAAHAHMRVGLKKIRGWKFSRLHSEPRK